MIRPDFEHHSDEELYGETPVAAEPIVTNRPLFKGKPITKKLLAERKKFASELALLKHRAGTLERKLCRNSYRMTKFTTPSIEGIKRRCRRTARYWPCLASMQLWLSMCGSTTAPDQAALLTTLKGRYALTVGDTIVVSGMRNKGMGGSWPRPVRWLMRHVPRNVADFIEVAMFDIQDALFEQFGFKFGPQRYKILEVSRTFLTVANRG